MGAALQILASKKSGHFYFGESGHFHFGMTEFFVSVKQKCRVIMFKSLQRLLIPTVPRADRHSEQMAAAIRTPGIRGVA